MIDTNLLKTCFGYNEWPNNNNQTRVVTAIFLNKITSVQQVQWTFTYLDPI